VAARDAGRESPHRLQLRNVVRCDLIERAVAPAVVRAADHQPTPGIRLQQPFRRDRRIALNQRGNRRRRGRRRPLLRQSHHCRCERGERTGDDRPRERGPYFWHGHLYIVRNVIE
jgi:hypothetical protein